VIDDNPIDRFLVEKVAVKTSFAKEVLSFDGAGPGLEYLKTRLGNDQEYPSLILLDINMPEIDGFGFLELYRELAPAAPVAAKIVMLTSSMDSSDYERAMSYPYVSGFLNKPLTPDKLQELR